MQPQNKAPTPSRQEQFAPTENYAMPPTHLVETLFDRPIAFHRVFAKLTGSLNAGLMLSQAVFWSKRTKDEAGWFYKSQLDWEDEVCLTRREQDTARATLRNQKRRNPQGDLLPPFWYEERRGIPARLFYRVEMDVLFLHLEAYHLANALKRQTEDVVQPDLTAPSFISNAPKRQTSLAFSAKLDATKPPNRTGGNVQTGLAENANHSLQRIHAKNTTKSSSSRRAHARNPAAAAAAASQFSELQIQDYLTATKPHNAARNSGLAHKLWLTGEDDHLIAHWQQQQQAPAGAATTASPSAADVLPWCEQVLKQGLQYDWEHEHLPVVLDILDTDVQYVEVVQQLRGLL